LLRLIPLFSWGCKCLGFQVMSDAAGFCVWSRLSGHSAHWQSARFLQICGFAFICSFSGARACTHWALCIHESFHFVRRFRNTSMCIRSCRSTHFVSCTYPTSCSLLLLLQVQYPTLLEILRACVLASLALDD
jgi:hypothetical protein